MKLWAKFFWRIVLPFLLALAMAIAELMPTGRRLGTPSGDSGLAGYIVVGLYAAIFCASFGIALRNTLRWGKEAEDYESHLKEADEFEKERRRRSSWRER